MFSKKVKNNILVSAGQQNDKDINCKITFDRQSSKILIDVIPFVVWQPKKPVIIQHHELYPHQVTLTHIAQRVGGAAAVGVR